MKTESETPPDVPGLVTVPSPHGAAQTLDRLAAALAQKGIKIFARIDHADGAREVNLPLRPTELLLFGNPQAGTPLMQSRQTIGIDLPLKALAWEDQNGQTWLSYNDVSFLARRHGIHDREPAIKAMTDLLKALALKTISPDAA